MNIKASIERLIRKCGLCPLPSSIRLLTMMTNITCPKDGWTQIYGQDMTIEEAIKRIEKENGPVKDISVNEIGATFLSCFIENKWHRCAIGKFSGVWSANFPSELIKQYEIGINRAIERNAQSEYREN